MPGPVETIADIWYPAQPARGVMTTLFALFVDGELAGHDGRAHAVAVFEHLEQVEAVLGAERGQPPVVHHQDLGLGERLEIVSLLKSEDLVHARD